MKGVKCSTSRVMLKKPLRAWSRSIIRRAKGKICEEEEKILRLVGELQWFWVRLGTLTQLAPTELQLGFTTRLRSIHSSRY